MQRLLEIMQKLRAPDGCPWDRDQTHLSLRRYLLEEAAEAVDAIGSGNSNEMAEELGDVLLQVAFHAVIAQEEGTFSYEDIEEAIVTKLVRRHPHVFGTAQVDGANEVVANWQAIKEEEKEAKRLRDRGANEPMTGEDGSQAGEGRAKVRAAVADVPRSLPALMRAGEVAKAAQWEVPAATPMLTGPAQHEIGDHLLEVARYARAHGVEPELALREAIDRASDQRAGG